MTATANLLTIPSGRDCLGTCYFRDLGGSSRDWIGRLHYAYPVVHPALGF